MSKKSTVDFMSGLRSMEERHGVRRHASAAPAISSADAISIEEQPPAVIQVPQQSSRRGKVAITQYVDPAVRKQIAQLALELDQSQGDLISEALNLLFEKYGKSPIAMPQS